ncbi:hypothetical protein F5Y07DRAFT_407285 [Xylaria sp. FL0933]|nr:hypothetical protein F5Y07DRAFT_407285 [Xylaria sp. FL0933]
MNCTPEPLPKRVRTSAASVGDHLGRETISEARVDSRRENGTWPTEEQEKTMVRFRDIAQHALARKDHRLPFAASQLRERKSASYKHLRYEGQLRERGSFMGKYEEGITGESKEPRQKLLRALKSSPEHTLFDDDLFEDTLALMKGRNETRVIRDIARLIVPPAENLAILGAEHPKIPKETADAG